MVKNLQAFHEIEKEQFEAVRQQMDAITAYGERFGIDPRLIASILYVELVQYSLEDIISALHRFKFSMLECKPNLFQPLLQFCNFSGGFSHIKCKTAERAFAAQKEKGAISEEEYANFSDYMVDPDTAIKAMALILKEHIEQWQEYYPVSENIEILSTLYNISDFVNKKPHANPQPGGSKKPVIVDGELFEKESFGKRCNMVYNSRIMVELFSQKEGLKVA